MKLPIIFTMKPPVLLSISALFFIFVAGCATHASSASYLASQGKQQAPQYIMGTGVKSKDQLSVFFLQNNPLVDQDKLERVARMYLEEAAIEGVNSDVAFIQMCLETGFLRFGGLVSEDMNNFCGLGSIGPGQRGLSFPDERTGIKAHVQHLKGYGSADPLNGELVDARYKYVNPKGKSPRITGLAGTWAADPNYGVKLTHLLDRLFSVNQ